MVNTGINIELMRKKVLLMKVQKARAMAAEAKKTIVVPRKPAVGVVGAMKAISSSFGVKTAQKELQKKPVVAAKTTLPVKTVLPDKTAPPATSPTVAKAASTSFGMKKKLPKEWPEKGWPEEEWSEEEWPEKKWPEKKWPRKPAATVSTALPTTPTPTTSFSANKELPEKPVVTVNTAPPVNTTQPAIKNHWKTMDAKSKSPSTSFKSKPPLMGFKQKASTSRGGGSGWPF
ncbi:hypothetical protein K440DRAFT_631095 [Wilcoxina mikolae CBS 423.85]|nr:hypothetical protein K440DRAFT_631095 [Wilcoxina mikolae CBS 423.85]